MNLIERSIRIIMRPKAEWVVIASEEANTKEILSQFLFPWLVFSALCQFLSSIVSGANIASAFGLGFVSIIVYGLLCLLEIWLLTELAPNFLSKQSFGRATQLVCYSLLPLLFGQLFTILPQLSWVGELLGLVSIAFFYLGFPVLLKTPESKIVKFIVASWVGMIVTLMVVQALFASCFYAFR